MRVLIVEDEPRCPISWRRALDEAGYAVDAAGTARAPTFSSAPNATMPSSSTSGCRESTA